MATARDAMRQMALRRSELYGPHTEVEVQQFYIDFVCHVQRRELAYRQLVSGYEKAREQSRVSAAEADLLDNPATNPNWSDLASISIELDARNNADENDDAAGMFAGALLVNLNAAIRLATTRMRLSQQVITGLGPVYGNVHLAELIRAGANNYRHHEEWTPPNQRAQQTINVLQSAGLVAPWDRNLAGDVLALFLPQD